MMFVIGAAVWPGSYTLWVKDIRSGGYRTKGNLNTELQSPFFHTYGNLFVNATTPPNTGYWVNVTDESNNTLLSYLKNGDPLLVNASKYPKIRLNLTLWTNDTNVTPVVHEWGYGLARREQFEAFPANLSAVMSGLGVELGRAGNYTGLPEFNVSTATNDQNYPVIAVDSKNSFVVAWSDWRSGTADIYAKVFNTTTGAQVGGEITVSNAASAQIHPSVAVDSKDNFVVAWYDHRSGTNDDIYAKVFNTTTGAQVGGEITVSNAANDQQWPSVAVDSKDNFIITWMDYRSGTYSDIYAKVFTTTGAQVGGEITVSNAANNQNSPSVAVDAKDNFVVTWDDARNDAADIYAKGFNTTTGAQVGGEITVSNAANRQLVPSVAVDAKDNFIITWEDYRSGTNWDIYARRFYHPYLSPGTTETTGRLASVPTSITPSWLQSTPPNTSVSVKIRLSSNNSTWSPWVNVTANRIYYSSDFTTWGPYLQYNITLNTSDANVTPVLSDFRIDYTAYLLNGSVESDFTAPPEGRITQAKITVSESGLGGAKLRLSDLNGTQWVDALNGTWTQFPVKGYRLRYHIDLSGDGNGTPLIDEVNITYTTETWPTAPELWLGTARIWQQSGEFNSTAIVNITDVLNMLIANATADAEGNVTIPIQVYSSTAGIVRLSDLNIVYDMPPRLLKSIEDRSMLEDTDAYGLYDLSGYFQADSDGGVLSYSVVFEGNSTLLHAAVNGSLLDFTTPTENANGDASFRVRATDEHGLFIESNNFTISVLPVNDPPEVLKDAAVAIDEDTSSANALDLKNYVTDVDTPLNKLTFMKMADDMADAGVSITDTGIVRISPAMDWNGVSNITYNVSDGQASATGRLNVTVRPVNDAPLLKIQDQFIQASGGKAEKDVPVPVSASRLNESLPTTLVDVDTPQSNLTLKATVGSQYVTQLSDDKNFKVFHLSMPASEGSYSITMMASDGFLQGNATFKVTVAGEPGLSSNGSLPNVTFAEDTVKERAFDLDNYIYDKEGRALLFVAMGYHNVTATIKADGWVDFSAAKDWYGTETGLFVGIAVGGGLPDTMLPCTVTVTSVNDPPRLILSQTNISVPINATIQIGISVSDVDTPISLLRLNISSKYVWVNGDKNYLVLNFTKPIGEELVTVILSDGELSDTEYLLVRVLDPPPPQPVLLAPLPDISFPEDTVKTNAFDLDNYFSGLNLTFEAAFNRSIHVKINTGNTVDFWADSDWNGMERLYFGAKDANGVPVGCYANVTVTPVNDPPIIKKQPGSRQLAWSKPSKAYETYALKLAWDPSSSDGVFWDNDTPVSELQFTSSASEFQVKFGYIFWTPKKGDTGKNFVLFSANDSVSTVTTQPISVTLGKLPGTTTTKGNDWWPWLVLAIIIIAACGAAYYLTRKNKGLEGGEGFAVEEVFVIYRDGRLIRHASRKLASEEDKDVLSSMLTAVQDFVREGLSKDEDSPLGSLEYGKNKIVLERSKNLLLAVAITGPEPEALRTEMKEVLSSIEAELGSVLAKWDGTKKELASVKKFIEPLCAYTPPPPTEEELQGEVKVQNALEFYQGFVRLKVAIRNNMGTVITAVSCEVLFEHDALKLDHIEPEYQMRGDKVVIGTIDPREKKTVAFYLDPQICVESYIDGTLSYKNAKGELKTLQMKRKRASVVCPVFYTEENINTAMLRQMIEIELQKKETKVFRAPKEMPLSKVFEVAKSAVQHHDVRLVREYKEKEPYLAEAWFYGAMKERTDKLVVKAGVSKESGMVEFFVASTSLPMVTGFLAELKKDLNDELKRAKRPQAEPITSPEVVEQVKRERTLLEKHALEEARPGETDQK